MKVRLFTFFFLTSAFCLALVFGWLLGEIAYRTNVFCPALFLLIIVVIILQARGKNLSSGGRL